MQKTDILTGGAIVKLVKKCLESRLKIKLASAWNTKSSTILTLKSQAKFVADNILIFFFFEDNKS